MERIEVALTGCGYGAIASLVFPTLIFLIEGRHLSRSSMSSPWAESLQVAFPYWVVTFPGALIGGALLALMIDRYFRQKWAAILGGIGIAAANAAAGGALNVLLGNPCNLHGKGTESVGHGAAGGLLAFGAFFIVTIPLGAAGGLLIRRTVSSMSSR